MHAMEISRTGLEVEWRRLELISENLANAGTAQTAYGQPYQPRHLVTGPATDFAALLDTRGKSVEFNADQLHGVQVYGTAADQTPPRSVHEPSNPGANADGFVTYPGIDQAAEMVLMIKTARVYEANIAAMNTAQQMYSRALELGGRT